MESLIKKNYNQFNLSKHDYFKKLQAGDISKKAFIASQKQMYWAVEFFSKPISILATKIPDINLRTNIVKNIWDEHGCGNIQLAHANTFVSFLSGLGVVDNSYLQAKQISAATNAFNTSLMGACYFYHYKFSAAVLGMIEKLFVGISNIINTVVITNNWIAKDDIIHYDVHTTLDIEHSRDFFQILEIPEKTEINLEDIQQGLCLGGHIFNKLYDDLLITANNN
jgi:pyrroloquinoline-quinone synthase